MRTGLGIIVVVVTALTVPRIRLTPSVPGASRRARSLARRLRMRQR
jgi:hypothetical protein